MMKCTVIGIAGGTGSAKSTFTARIKAAFSNKVSVLALSARPPVLVSRRAFGMRIPFLNIVYILFGKRNTQ